MANALVTGGAGFIGSSLVEELIADGSMVTVVDNLRNGRRDNLPQTDPGHCRLVVADIRDTGLMRDLMRETDIVFHLACLGVRHSIHSPTETHDVNATATLRLLLEARAAGVARFVHVSSSEVYGTARFVPMREEHPTCPATVYGASKLAGECYARAFHATYGFPTVVLRPFNAYGPRCHHEGDSGEAIPKFILRALAGKPLIIFGDGMQTRDFTYVTDTAKGIAQAGACDDATGKTINLGSGQEITILSLAKMAARVCGRSDAEIVHYSSRPGDVQRLCADPTVARELLAFSPKVSLTQGLSSLRDWYHRSSVPPEKLLADELVHNWEQPGSEARG